MSAEMTQSNSSQKEDEVAQPLLPSRESHNISRCSKSSWPLRIICIPSKAIFILLAWTLVVSEFYSLIHAAIAVFISTYVPMGQDHFVNALSPPIGFACAVLVVIGIFYPLSGFLADVYFGRIKIILCSLTLLLISLIIVAWSSLNDTHQNMQFVMLRESVPLYVAFFGASLFIIIGYTAYQANFIQLGLDQLIEAPSTKLSVFVNWAIWADTLGMALVSVTVALISCLHTHNNLQYLSCIVPLFTVLCLPLLLVLACWKRHWFYVETDLRNPYKTVFKVINFTRKHNYPLCCSAFTYADVDMASRMDFAKERYGGPFTTEQVEDVKDTF